ncbi:MAG: acetylxylan esterase [Lentisphaeria bacterium]|nr:acetylxylan esterase [Lentisphaeria bacterium]
MNGKHLFAAAFLLSGLLSAQEVAVKTENSAKPAPAAQKAAAELAPRLIAYAERPSAVYKAGEKIKFKIWLIQPKANYAKDPVDPGKEKQLEGQKLQFELTGDGSYSKKGSIKSAGSEGADVEASLNRPGFVLLKVTCWYKGKRIVRFAGAGVEPEKIVSGTKMPADFEAYWKERIRKMRERKPEITVKEITDGFSRSFRENARFYDVRIADGEINATGILTIPRWPDKKKMPVVITFGGASWIGARIRYDDAIANNAIYYCMNIHDTVNQVTGEMKTQLRKRPDIAAYQYNNLLDKEKYMPGKIFLRIVRSLDYLKTRPEWNGKDLIATGPSFGGCQTIVATALDPQVSLCFPGGAAMCDHLGSRNNQIDGWPKLLKRYQANPEQRKQAEENSAYFDAANMARLIHCPTVFAVGFIDQTCPPTSVYAAFNNVPSKNKRMMNATRAAHGGSSKQWEPGAFGPTLSPLFREACRGTELLVNGYFRYRNYDKGKWTPYGWKISGEATVSGDPEKNTCVAKLKAETKIVQKITNIRGTVCKAVLKGQVRGKGTLTVRLEGQPEPFVCKLEDGSWKTFEHEFTLPEGLRDWTLELKAAGGDLELKELSMKY